MTAIALDASAARSWLAPSQAAAAADQFAKQTAGARFVAPVCFRWEVRNVLLDLHRRGRSPPGGVQANLLMLESRVSFDAAADATSTLALFARIEALASAHRLRFYDAAYLELAQRFSADLASRDGTLLAAASACGVDVHDLRQ